MPKEIANAKAPRKEKFDICEGEKWPVWLTAEWTRIKTV